MKNLNKKGSFEAHWEKAFRDAHKKPPDAVWDRISSELTRSELSGVKKRLLFFKWLAAASVLLAMGMGFYSLYFRDNPALKDEISMVQETVRPVEEGRDAAAGAVQDGEDQTARLLQGQDGLPQVATAETGEGKSGDSEENIAMMRRAAVDRSGEVRSSGAPGFVPVAERERVENPSGGTTAAVPQAAVVSYPAPVQPVPDIPEMEAPPLPVAYMYRRPVVPVNQKNRKNEVPAQLFAGLTFSTGRFDPNFKGGDVEAFSNADLALYSGSTTRTASVAGMAGNTTVSNETYQPDVSYAYGLNMGARVGGRWVVRGGLSYVKANSLVSTTALIQDYATNERYPVLKSVNYESDGVVEIRRTEETQYANTFEFASVPVKAGYIVLDKKLDLTVFGGVSSEFFIRNTITQKSNLTTAFKNVPGDDSPYRSVYFNGSLSTALGYTIANHYRLSVEPGYRMALNNFTRDSFILTGKPDAFYLNFGVSYRFK